MLEKHCLRLISSPKAKLLRPEQILERHIEIIKKSIILLLSLVAKVIISKE